MGPHTSTWRGIRERAMPHIPRNTSWNWMEHTSLPIPSPLCNAAHPSSPHLHCLALSAHGKRWRTAYNQAADLPAVFGDFIPRALSGPRVPDNRKNIHPRFPAQLSPPNRPQAKTRLWRRKNQASLAPDATPARSSGESATSTSPTVSSA